MNGLSGLLSNLDFGHDRFELCSSIVLAANARSFAEIGVWKGDFSARILSSNKQISVYYMIDPWVNLPDWNKPANVSNGEFDRIYQIAMRRTAFASEKIKILRGSVKEMVSEIPDESLDMVYIDGDHTLRGITIDLIKVAPKIKEGGYILGDDFTVSPWQHPKSFEPTLVFPFSVYFAEAMGFSIAALPFNQFIMQKSSSSKFEFIDTTGSYGNVSLSKLKGSRSIWSDIKFYLRNFFEKY